MAERRVGGETAETEYKTPTNQRRVGGETAETEYTAPTNQRRVGDAVAETEYTAPTNLREAGGLTMEIEYFRFWAEYRAITSLSAEVEIIPVSERRIGFLAAETEYSAPWPSTGRVFGPAAQVMA